MRNIITITDQILALLTPVTPPDGSNQNLTVALATVQTIRKQAMYYAPEADDVLWSQLSQTLYRYLPPPTSAPFDQISNIVTGSTAGAESAKK
jgi:hypothetical protein